MIRKGGKETVYNKLQEEEGGKFKQGRGY
jgi:hypothetical protein